MNTTTASEGVKPDMHSFKPLDEVESDGSTARAMAAEMQDRGATWIRLTVISDEHPYPPYPHGLYLEAWLERPDQEAPFNYPLVADTVNQRP